MSKVIRSIRHFYLLISMTLVTSCWHSALASRAIAFTYSRNFESLILRPAAMSKRAGATTSSQTKRTKTQQSLSGFFASNSKKTNEDVKSSEEISSDAPSTTSSGYKVFCDLDGVLVDFDSGVKKLFNGRAPDELPNQGMMWGSIHKASEFYAKLPWMKDGKFLWEELKNNLSTPPDILTGCPRSIKSRAEKFAWCKKELGVRVNHLDMAGKKYAHEITNGSRRRKDVVNVITCWSKNKHHESRENHVLIDDRLSLAEEWENKGGVFIHHTSTEQTLLLLREKGILQTKK